MIRRRDWLLLFLGSPGGKYPSDRIRIMKGMFLLSVEGPKETRGLYDFEPYAYGPFDSEIYRDLEALESEALIRPVETDWSGRKAYELTMQGRTRFEELKNQVSADTLEKIHQIKLLVTSASFLELLKHVYERHPSYAVKSVAKL